MMLDAICYYCMRYVQVFDCIVTLATSSGFLQNPLLGVGNTKSSLEMSQSCLMRQSIAVPAFMALYSIAGKECAGVMRAAKPRRPFDNVYKTMGHDHIVAWQHTNAIVMIFTYEGFQQ